ncbi:oxidoreductase [Mucilaginibacter sp. 14171R-50]|uniref:WD40/YVTN/BNR-like repeat-containing protein n=1 Tax=Mucilaginibacter sp. 14171R-50 TaxID=2703789 RepID=UPI00138CE27A|nr:YCF48-related protein [Mucilaginibacter sp. 14171R-50]QHS56053.1 oxidoreductase [Mucilaginibacter sp. 14171R-50]
MGIKKYILLVVLLSAGICLKAQKITPIEQNRPNSFRGLSVVNDNIAWVSGTAGTIGVTRDGGFTWTWQQVKGFEKCDFRDIEAFSDTEAIVISSGSPAYILKTTDGGTSWTIKYQKTDTAYFLDAMDFSDKQHGFVLGDPINNKFLLLQTLDGGETWSTVVNAPLALKNEAAFAASGTCLRVTNKITIVTGGSNSRILTSPLINQMWTATSLPLTDGTASRGAFSVAFGNGRAIIVGGNYAKDQHTDSVAYLFRINHTSYTGSTPASGPAGYQSCVEYIKGNTFLSTGTPGTNVSTDGGNTWHKIDSDSYNVCKKAKNGSLVLMAGDKGKLAIVKF